ncbi:MAG: HD domain-containing phosphohydrolase [Actinomycetota bacterium]
MSEKKQINIKDIKELLSISNQINNLFAAEKNPSRLLDFIARCLSECSLFSFCLIKAENKIYGCREVVSYIPGSIMAGRNTCINRIKESTIDENLKEVLLAKNINSIACIGTDCQKEGYLAVGSSRADVFCSQPLETIEAISKKIFRIVSDRRKLRLKQRTIGLARLLLDMQDGKSLADNSRALKQLKKYLGAGEIKIIAGGNNDENNQCINKSTPKGEYRVAEKGFIPLEKNNHVFGHLMLDYNNQGINLDREVKIMQAMVKKFCTGFLVKQKKEEKYRSIFHSLPIAMIEFEFGPILDYVGRLKAKQLEDIKEHICSHFDEMRNLFSGVKLINTNPEALRLYEADSRKAFSENIEGTVTVRLCQKFAEMAAALNSGRRAGEVKARIRTLKGKIKDVNLRWTLVSGCNSNSILAISLADITRKKRMEKKLRKSIMDLEKNFKGAIDTLSKIVEVRDPYTAGHQKKVARLSVAISKEMGLGRDFIRPLSLAAAIHDIGKINIPASILAKPGKLTQIEYSMIKTHPRLGYSILDKIKFPWPIHEIILQHHERIDGSGYPQGLREDEIMTEAKILAVADVVEAMSSHRPYRPSLGIDAALKEIETNKGKLYCRRAAEACIRLVKEKRFCF